MSLNWVVIVSCNGLVRNRRQAITMLNAYLDSKVHGANMGPSGADRTQVGPMLAPWTLQSGYLSIWPGALSCWVHNGITIPIFSFKKIHLLPKYNKYFQSNLPARSMMSSTNLVIWLVIVAVFLCTRSERMKQRELEIINFFFTSCDI